jgi:hypothetical protein
MVRALSYSGKTKLAVCRRLGDNWQDVADYFDISAAERQGFSPGRQPQGVWEWLEERNRLAKLPEALTYIGRDDLVAELVPPSEPPASAPERLWQGSPFPGLCSFTPDDSPIFFGRDRETAALMVRLRQERFVAVVGASGSGKSSLVAAGVLPRLHDIPGG